MTAPLITNDAIILGILIAILAFVFKTSESSNTALQKFYKYVPSLLLCYFLPSICTSVGIFAPEWYSIGDVAEFFAGKGIDVPEGMGQEAVKAIAEEHGIALAELDPFQKKSSLYHVASRYLLPASLVLLSLNIDLKGIIGLGPKALIMFFTATVGIIVGAPLALWLVGYVAPNVFYTSGGEAIWPGLATVAGSWIGGGANQTAMKEIFGASDKLFSAMIVVDVFVANLWMAFLLYGAGNADKLDLKLKADSSAIESLKTKMVAYSEKISRTATTSDMFVIAAVGFGAVGLSHLIADIISPVISGSIAAILAVNPDSWVQYITSFGSGFFWLVVCATTFGVLLSFTKAREYEGAGASKVGNVFLYLLVATIGMKMNIAELIRDWEVFKYLIIIGLVWMAIHISILLLVAKLIKAPFFFVAIGSQANVGGAASAPIVASAFSPVLAPVGVLLAVLGYAIGTFGAILAAMMMQGVSI
ncbi:MAG: DUF819 family protein [Flavobacteriales bacterium]|nr:DUF819 family protein [Flavobacteriales bacterium]